MAKATLPTNYKDDILNSSMNGKRRYQEIPNSDGTISLEDKTTYDQTGTNFGASQVNEMNRNINESADAGRIIDSLSSVMTNTQQKYIAGALALKEVNNSLKANNKQFYFDYKDGKYGFNTDPNRGADTFSPFSSGINLSNQDTGSYTTTNIEQTITTNLNKINFLVMWWANGASTEAVWLNGEQYGDINNTLKVVDNTFTYKAPNVGFQLNWLVLGE